MTNKDFKDGVTDALLCGEGMREKNRTSLYKQGYDFGMYLWNEQQADDLKEIKD
jgi:hypothetical protein